MGITVLAVAVGLVIGYATGGRVIHVGDHALKRLWLLGIGVVLQGAVFASNSVPWEVLALSYACLALFAIFNFRVAGMAVLAVGILANTVVVLLNGGMPVRGSAIVDAGIAKKVDLDRLDIKGKRHLETSDDVLGFLGDIVPVPLPVQPYVVSFGDLIMYIGLADAIVHLMRPRKRRPTLFEDFDLDLDDKTDVPAPDVPAPSPDRKTLATTSMASAVDWAPVLPIVAPGDQRSTAAEVLEAPLPAASTESNQPTAPAAPSPAPRPVMPLAAAAPAVTISAPVVPDRPATDGVGSVDGDPSVADASGTTPTEASPVPAESTPADSRAVQEQTDQEQTVQEQAVEEQPAREVATAAALPAPPAPAATVIAHAVPDPALSDPSPFAPPIPSDESATKSGARQDAGAAPADPLAGEPRTPDDSARGDASAVRGADDATSRADQTDLPTAELPPVVLAEHAAQPDAEATGATEEEPQAAVATTDAPSEADAATPVTAGTEAETETGSTPPEPSPDEIALVSGLFAYAFGAKADPSATEASATEADATEPAERATPEVASAETSDATADEKPADDPHDTPDGDGPPQPAATAAEEPQRPPARPARTRPALFDQDLWSTGPTPTISA